MSALAQQTPFPLMVNMWDYTHGASDGTPIGISNWANGEGRLTITGTQGSSTVTINSVNVGAIADYQIDTPHGSPGWAIVIPGDDNVYRVYTVYAVNTANMTLSIYPALEASSTAQIASNFYDAYGGPHLTTLGFYGLADFLVAQTKATSYLQKYAARFVSDGKGNYAGTGWTAIGGLQQGQNGLVPPTNCMTQGVFTYTSNIYNAICNSYSGSDRTYYNGSYYQTLIGAATQGQGAKLTATLNGRSGYLDTFVGIEGQYQSEQASARVQVYIDGNLVLNQNFAGLTHIQVPFTHAQTGEIDVTVDSPYPCAARISNTNWYVWDDSVWNGVSPSDPLIPNGAKVLVVMDSWGVWHNAAFVTRLQQDLPGSSVTNVSVDSTTAAWAIQNFTTLTAGGPYDYIISDFQINDLKPAVNGESFTQLLSDLETLWSLVLNSGATPIYTRSLTTASIGRIQLLNEWDQTLTASYPTQIESQGEQFITFPNPGPQTYGVAPLTLAATATSGLPVTYTVVSGPATVNGSTLTITGAGSVTVQASQAGNSQWLAAPPVSVTFSVSPAVLTVTANSTSMTYGGTLPAFTASYTGFVNGDGQGVLSGSPSLTTTATSGSPVGSYVISTAQGTLAAPNYTFVFVNGTLTINPATLTVTAQNATGVYGQSLPGLSYIITGFVNGDGQGVVNGSPALSTTASQNSPPGTYPISISQGTLSAQNYVFAFVAGMLTLQQAASSASVTSTLSSLYPNQSTTLTATVSVTGSGGAPTGTVNFMLGQAVLGSGTLVASDGTDATATMQVLGSQLATGPNSITAVYTGDVNYSGSTSSAITVTLLGSGLSFGTVSVGTTSPVQTLTYIFSADATLSGIGILTAGAPNLDYSDGGASTCTIGTPYISGQSCTVTVAFHPTAPGTRAGAVELFAQGSNLALTTWYLSGTGGAAAVTIDPGTQTTLASIANGATYGSTIDGAGNVYVADNANGQVIEIAAGTQNQSTVIAGLTAPTSVALDGAGNLYVASTGGVLMVPNENGTLNSADAAPVNVSGLGLAQGLATDASGNLYVSDGTNGTVLQVPLGSGMQNTIASGLTNPQGIAVDSALNVYVASGNQVSEYPAIGGGPVTVGSGFSNPQGISVDASGTVYVADTGNNRVVAVPPNGSQSVIAVAGTAAPQAVTSDTAGNVYVSDGSSVYEVNRTQPAALNFGSENVGSTSPPQTLTVSNVGNQMLTASALVIPANFTQQASGGIDCSSTSQVAGGAACAIAVAFAPTTAGALSGNVTLTDNALNNPGSIQSISVSGTGVQTQQQQTITFPNPGTQTYGVAPITLTATASSGLPVSYTIISGPATVSGNVLTVTGAGMVTVEAGQAGNDQWLPAPPVQDTFVVNPAVLTVTANPASMSYGGTLPTFSATITGFVNGDGSGVVSGSPSLTTTATSGSPVGTYTITAAQGTLAAPNYTFAFVNGTLTINPATLTVTANPASMTYGGTLPAFTATITGFVNGDGSGVVSGSPSLTTTATSGSPVGTYTISAAQGTLAARNYTFMFVNGTLTINPATLTVAANNLTNTSGNPLPTLTYTVTGFVNGDGQGVLNGTPALSTTATQWSPPGSYPIMISQGTLSAQNYVFVFVNGVLTVTVGHHFGG